MIKILYLHGFLSSPFSTKVTQLCQSVGEGFEVLAPDLNLAPLDVDRLLDSLVTTHRAASTDPLVVVGSSLGGFYAARVATKFGLRAVLLNPCFNPWAFIGSHTGVQTIYGTDRTLDVRPSFVDDLRALADDVSPLEVDPQRTLAVFGTADEVLDWQAGAKAYASCRQVILPGEDHRISQFESLIPRILDFVSERS